MVEADTINLSVIQSDDPQAISLTQTAKNVAHYKFVNNEWIETNIKGVLFIYKRSINPQFSLFILNRLRVKNLIQPLDKDIEFELKEPYIFYKINNGHDSEQEIFGIWFSNAKECQCIFMLLKMLTDENRFSKELHKNGKNTMSDTLMIPINLNSLLNNNIDLLPKKDSKVGPINITEKIFEKSSASDLETKLFKPQPLNPILNALQENDFYKREPMIKQDLKKSLIYLLENDNDFLDKIYDAYKKVHKN